MEIAAALNVHNNPDLALDTLDSIYKWMTNQVVVVVDAAGYPEFQNVSYKDVKFEEGHYHKFERSPYKNCAYSLIKMYERWPSADWYCSIEYDCLVVSNAFKFDLKTAAQNNVWVIGNDVRRGGKLPELIDEIVGMSTGEVVTMLGCCLFYSHDFIEILNDKFLHRLLEVSEHFKPGYFPDFHGYALEEELFPTLATHYGGKAEELAAYEWYNNRWRGKYTRYPMRFPDPIKTKDIFADTCIIHPIKDFNDPIREYFRKKRGS